MKNKNKFAIIYCRVASASQIGINKSLVEQEKICLKFAKKQKNRKVKVISDIGSGNNLRRRGIKDIVNFVINKKVNSVYISEPSRLSRNPLDFLRIRNFLSRHNVGLKIVNNN